MSDSGSVAEGVADSQCAVEFFGVAAGNYHVAVSGPNIVGSDNREFSIDNRGSEELDVSVRTSGASTPDSTSPGMVAAANLKVPRNAKKKFERASELIAKNDLPKAIDQLHQAVGIYPSYAEAYNDLGVVYRRLGDNAHSREALEEALRLNDHLAPAYANLARLEIGGRNYSAAENLLDKATATGLDDTPTLMLLASVELQTQHYDRAIANCHKAHATPQIPHAVAHYMAARAYEHENRLTDAVSELRTFLSEEQSGARADEARKEIAALQAAVK
jgi:tetratricopeptide (TPR) repeat protein